MEHTGARVQELMEQIEKTSSWEPPTVLCLAVDHLSSDPFSHLVGIVTEKTDGTGWVWHVVDRRDTAVWHAHAYRPDGTFGDPRVADRR